MSKKSEEAAMKLFPVEKAPVPVLGGGYIVEDMNLYKRKIAEYVYEQAEKDLGWHSVEGSLPEVDEEVIVLTDHLNLDCFYKIGFGHIVNEEARVDIDGKPYKPESHNGWNTPGVKYWMPMPKVPEE